MATVVLAAAGTALGGAYGGAVLGVGSAAIGQAAGAVLGGLIDQRVLGGGSSVVERGRTTSLRLQTGEEGAPIPRVYGRMRVAGQVIWSTRFRESVAASGGGKGGPRVRDFSYSLSFAVGLCEGPIDRIGRVWADGRQMALDGVAWRLHRGREGQMPDPLIEAVEGAAPAFRGLAYLVFEEMPVGPYGNRMPQISVEVFRAPRAGAVETAADDLSLRRIVKAVAMSPGSGEFAYDTQPVRALEGEGAERVLNVNTPGERTDAVVSLDQLEGELESCRSISLVASWFGTDLRADRCEIRPGVEYRETITAPGAWRAGGATRATAHLVGRDGEGRPIYGGTPDDASLVRYIREAKARGFRVMFYPFILMDVPPGNALTDPWTGETGQPVYPWRGRITTSRAPGVSGSVDGTPAAADEAAAFFGGAAPGDFVPSGDAVLYAGPEEWGLRRFILHYAHLCRLAGGVDAFCIGSELRGLTQIRAGRNDYPAVEALRVLARDVRTVVGSTCKLGYAADWSEYFGHQPQDGTGDRLFHLDPLWADEAIDFVGIDWYAPITDWRDGREHLDAAEAESIHDLDYLADRLGAGEDFDWFYASQADRRAQRRTPIRDGAHGEDWIWRSKDLEAWWASPHHERIDGVRQPRRTAWRPKSKPIWLTEIGCGAVDKGSNQPNLFVDPKSSENALPAFSDGSADPLIQRRVLQAATKRWRSTARNPVSPIYGGRMLDLDNAYAWTWDARPWPAFPERLEVWSDGGNHALGHWLNGRVAAADLDALVAEICREAGLRDVDVSGLDGLVEGFVQAATQPPRAALEALMLAWGFDAVEDAGRLRFVMRGRGRPVALDEEALAAEGAGPGRDLERSREAEGAALARVRVGYLRADGGYQNGTVEAINPQTGAEGVQGSDLPIAMSRGRAAAVAERWARESETGRETARFALGPAQLDLRPGDTVRFGPTGAPEYRIDRIEDGLARRVEATRTEPAIYARGERPTGPEPRQPAADGTAPGRPAFRLLDLPWSVALSEERRGHVAVWSSPWPGPAAVWASARNEGFEPAGLARRPATAGRLLEPLPAGAPWREQRGPGMRVALASGAFASVDQAGLLAGANALALAADGEWELLQFREAELVAPGEWRLSGLYRGLGGTEPLIGDPAPVGATVVSLDRHLVGLDFGEVLTGAERRYRIGPASRDIGDASYAEAAWTYRGVSLRPHAPAAVRIVPEGGGLRVSWVRRSRRDAGLWLEPEPPLVETEERYRVRLLNAAGQVVRVERTASPSFLYEAASRASDGTATGSVTAEVAQISAAWGPGFYGKATFDG